MLVSGGVSLDESMKALARAIDQVRVAAARESSGSRVHAASKAVRGSDLLMSLVADLIGSERVEELTGLPTETMLNFAGRRTGWEARSITKISARLLHMPLLAASLRTGDVSWPQVRGIMRSAERLPISALKKIDEQIDAHRAEFGASDTDRLVNFVDDAAANYRPI